MEKTSSKQILFPIVDQSNSSQEISDLKAIFLFYQAHRFCVDKIYVNDLISKINNIFFQSQRQLRKFPPHINDKSKAMWYTDTDQLDNRRVSFFRQIRSTRLLTHTIQVGRA